jgi:hypothetical protein
MVAPVQSSTVNSRHNHCNLNCILLNLQLCYNCYVYATSLELAQVSTPLRCVPQTQECLLQAHLWPTGISDFMPPLQVTVLWLLITSIVSSWGWQCDSRSTFCLLRSIRVYGPWINVRVFGTEDSCSKGPVLIPRDGIMTSLWRCCEVFLSAFRYTPG